MRNYLKQHFLVLVGDIRVEKRGQGAIEYIILFAVVVIMILIVIGILGPKIGNSSQEASELYWESADISIISYSLNSSGDFLFTLRNNLDTSIRIQSISLGDSRTANLSLTLLPGSRIETSIAEICINEGDPFDFGPVFIEYSDLSTGTNHSFSGTVNLVGTCVA
ncbi:MAG: class III signal peptide-containing protein [bacterium]|nr:class III signal peptide-containing protein [bacterium]